MAVPEMPCEFHANDGHSTLEQREAEWVERATLLILNAFPGTIVLHESEQAA